MSAAGNAFAEIRGREFNWSPERAYFNAASFGPLPARTLNAVTDFNSRRHHLQLTDADLMVTLQAARSAAARLIGVNAAEIALGPNTNVGINIAATAVLQRAGDRRTVVLSDREFPANVYPWLALERAGLKAELIATDARGWPREDAILERIERGDVAAVSVSFVQFASGFRANLAEIGRACRAHDVLFVVDAIQGLGALPLDARACSVDILACGGQKWLCSPWGSGFTYVRAELIQSFEPLLPGWLSFTAALDFTRLTEYRYDLLPDARRFEVGSLGFQDYVGLAHSLELLLELGQSAVWQHIRSVQEPIISWARERGVGIVSDLTEERRSGLLCLRPGNAAAAQAQLVQAGVACAFRENAIRLSPHWYNTSEEAHRVVSILEQSLMR